MGPAPSPPHQVRGRPPLPSPLPPGEREKRSPSPTYAADEQRGEAIPRHSRASGSPALSSRKPRPKNRHSRASGSPGPLSAVSPIYIPSFPRKRESSFVEQEAKAKESSLPRKRESRAVAGATRWPRRCFWSHWIPGHARHDAGGRRTGAFQGRCSTRQGRGNACCGGNPLWLPGRRSDPGPWRRIAGTITGTAIALVRYLAP